MQTTRPSQLPSWLLVVGMFLLGVCALPAALFFLVTGISGDSGISPFLVFGLGVPTLVAYPVAAWLWLRARRAADTRRAWLLPRAACYWSSRPRPFRWVSSAGHWPRSGGRPSRVDAATGRPTASGDSRRPVVTGGGPCL